MIVRRRRGKKSGKRHYCAECRGVRLVDGPDVVKFGARYKTVVDCPNLSARPSPPPNDGYDGRSMAVGSE